MGFNERGLDLGVVMGKGRKSALLVLWLGCNQIGFKMESRKWAGQVHGRRGE